MRKKEGKKGLYSILKSTRRTLDKEHLNNLFDRIEQVRVDKLAQNLKADLLIHIPRI